MRITFVVPGLPVAQPRSRAASFGGKARIVGFDDRHPVTAFKAAVRLTAAAVMDGPPLTGPVRLLATFAFPRPKRLTWARRPMPRAQHVTKPDADNLMKSLCDALNGVAWVDDAQVVDARLAKCYAAGNEAPHVAVEIETIGGVPAA